MTYGYDENHLKVELDSVIRTAESVPGIVTNVSNQGKAITSLQKAVADLQNVDTARAGNGRLIHDLTYAAGENMPHADWRGSSKGLEKAITSVGTYLVVIRAAYEGTVGDAAKGFIGVGCVFNGTDKVPDWQFKNTTMRTGEALDSIQMVFTAPVAEGQTLNLFPRFYQSNVTSTARKVYYRFTVVKLSNNSNLYP